MATVDRFKLIHGPYLPPKTRRGRRLFCEVRGTVKVGGYGDGLIPWPRVKKGGSHSLILCGDLVRAVRLESTQAAEHWRAYVRHDPGSARASHARARLALC